MRTQEMYQGTRESVKDPEKVFRIQEMYKGSRESIEKRGIAAVEKLRTMVLLRCCRGQRQNKREPAMYIFFYIMLKVFSYQDRNMF